MKPSAVLRLWCCGAVAVAAAAGTPAAPAAATEQPVRSAEIAEQVRALDEEVTRVSAELAEGVQRYEQAQDAVAQATQDRTSARDDAQALQADAVASRASFDGLARQAYKGGVPPLVTALLSGDPRTLGDLAYVQRSFVALGVTRSERAEERHRSAGDALAQSDADRQEAVLLQQAVDDELADLLAQADRLSEELSVAADALAAARAEEAARARALAAEQARERAAARAAAAAAGLQTAPSTDVGGLDVGSAADGECGPPSTFGEANGFLPASTLCPLSTGRGHRLRTDAARALDQLAAAYASSLGRPLCITDSYRSFPAQVDVFARKPSLAAVPGTSQHGWGLAVDLCGGIQTFGTEAHEWMRAHAPTFGWHHPQWARQGGRKPEAWHWEFAAG